MSTLERWLIKSPFRAWLQRGEIRAFVGWAALSPGASVLDMGCGQGVSTAFILEVLRPRRLAAFDFDPSMIEAARDRLARDHQEQSLSLAMADATHMPYGDGVFDAVFESGVIHHVPDWRAAVREVGRVLKPGARFCFAEPSRGRLRQGLYRMLPHAVESMFDAEDWRSVLSEVGLKVEAPLRRLPLWDICGVANKET
jgi:ubiquinone/menaquinone biosynthesis C-methylase UbiE